MTISLPDALLKESGLTERELTVELACWLFDRERLTLWPAAQLAGLSRIEFEVELIRRRIPIHRPTVEDLESDLKALRRLESAANGKGDSRR